MRTQPPATLETRTAPPIGCGWLTFKAPEPRTRTRRAAAWLADRIDWLTARLRAWAWS